MKVPNKRELQIALSNSSDSDFRDFMIINKNVLQNRIIFVVTDKSSCIR